MENDPSVLSQREAALFRVIEKFNYMIINGEKHSEESRRAMRNAFGLCFRFDLLNLVEKQ